MLFPKLFNSDRPILTSIRGIFNNRVATLADVDQVVEYLNTATNGKPTSFFYNFVDSSSFSVTSLGSTCSCADCGSANNCSGCPPANDSKFYKCAAAKVSFNNTTDGAYTLTLDPDFTYTDTALRIGNLSDATNTVSLTKVSSTSYTISTKNSAGSATSGVLNGALVEVIFFP